MDKSINHEITDGRCKRNVKDSFCRAILPGTSTFLDLFFHLTENQQQAAPYSPAQPVNRAPAPISAAPVADYAKMGLKPSGLSTFTQGACPGRRSPVGCRDPFSTAFVQQNTTDPRNNNCSHHLHGQKKQAENQTRMQKAPCWAAEVG